MKDSSLKKSFLSLLCLSFLLGSFGDILKAEDTASATGSDGGWSETDSSNLATMTANAVVNDNNLISTVGGGMSLNFGAQNVSKCGATGGAAAHTCKKGVAQLIFGVALLKTAQESSSVGCEIGSGQNCAPPSGVENCQNPIFLPGGGVGCGDPNNNNNNNNTHSGLPDENLLDLLDDDFPGLKERVISSIKDLNEQGIQLDFENQTVSGGPFGSGATPIASLKGGGGQGLLSSAKLKKEILKKIQAIKKRKGRVSSMGFNNQGGGGGSYGASSERSAGYNPYAKAFSLFNKKRKPSSVSVQGKSKMYGESPVGVKMDNIFEMVHRNYQRKRRMNGFVR